LSWTKCDVSLTNEFVPPQSPSTKSRNAIVPATII
jgi:hypothetical protein